MNHGIPKTALRGLFAGYVKNELARWTKVLKEMGINEAP